MENKTAMQMNMSWQPPCISIRMGAGFRNSRRAGTKYTITTLIDQDPGATSADLPNNSPHFPQSVELLTL